MPVVRKGEEVCRVSIVHWWPGRYYEGWIDGDFRYAENPFPAYMRMRAHKMRSKYMTMARVRFKDGELVTYATCCQKDQPSRATGRLIALIRMGRLLNGMGLKMEKA